MRIYYKITAHKYLYYVDYDSLDLSFDYHNDDGTSSRIGGPFIVPLEIFIKAFTLGNTVKPSLINRVEHQIRMAIARDAPIPLDVPGSYILDSSSSVTYAVTTEKDFTYNQLEYRIWRLEHDNLDYISITSDDYKMLLYSLRSS